jgi:hypothetical protein
MGNIQNFSNEHGHKNMAKHKMFNTSYIAQPSDTRRSLNLRCGIHIGLCRHVGSWVYCPHTAGEAFYFTGTTEQGTSGAAEMRETAELSNSEQQ